MCFAEERCVQEMIIYKSVLTTATRVRNASWSRQITVFQDGGRVIVIIFEERKFGYVHSFTKVKLLIVSWCKLFFPVL